MHHKRIDRLAWGDSPIHHLDGRSKLIAVIVFTVFVVSVPSDFLSILSCYAVWPFALLVVAGVPLKFVLKQILYVSPFIVVLAASSLFYGRGQVDVTFGPFQWSVSTGVIRCLSIVFKFIITMAALISLVATTRFSELLKAMSKIGVPRLLVMQLGFLYRYIFMLIDKGRNIIRARSGRKLRNLGFKRELNTASAMVGTLFIDGLDTASRINTAMQARGFTGEINTLSQMRFGKNDAVFISLFVVYLATLYLLAGAV